LGSGSIPEKEKENAFMERRTQLSIILINTPGELAKLCDVLRESNINILAMNIQNAKDAVKELFKIREKTRRRIALAESYRGILKDSSDYSIIRILVDSFGLHPDQQARYAGAGGETVGGRGDQYQLYIRFRHGGCREIHLHSPCIRYREGRAILRKLMTRRPYAGINH
jgi:hypothetical protein